MDGLLQIETVTAFPENVALLCSLNEMCHALGKQTIAASVAEFSTVTLLQEVGIDFAQGYRLGAPPHMEHILSM